MITMDSMDSSEPNRSQSQAAQPQVQQPAERLTPSDQAAGYTPLCPQQFTHLYQPDEMTVVCGMLDTDKVKALAAAGVEHVINMQSDDELAFDEAQAVLAAGMSYSHLPISHVDDLNQVNMLNFDKILRQYHGKKVAIHCSNGDRVGAAVALRSGWLRGRKMDTALARGEAHGLTTLTDEVYKRLLVPR